MWLGQYDMVIGVLTPSSDHFSFYTALDLTLAVASASTIWYLLRPNVKCLFGIISEAHPEPEDPNS
jgi:hypothetical protein